MMLYYCTVWFFIAFGLPTARLLAKQIKAKPC